MFVLAHRSNADIADWSLEFDQWMRPIVMIARVGLAVAAEVRVVANSTLEPNARNVVVLVLAQWTVAVNTNVSRVRQVWFRNGIVECSEAMIWVLVASSLDALRAEIPIGADQTLVSDTKDILITAIANGRMSHIAAGSTQSFSSRAQSSACHSWFERVTWMMTVGVALVARQAEIIIFAVPAGHEMILREHFGSQWQRYLAGSTGLTVHARIASARRPIFLSFFFGLNLLIVGECARHLCRKIDDGGFGFR